MDSAINDDDGIAVGTAAKRSLLTRVIYEHMHNNEGEEMVHKSQHRKSTMAQNQYAHEEEK